MTAKTKKIIAREGLIIVGSTIMFLFLSSSAYASFNIFRMISNEGHIDIMTNLPAFILWSVGSLYLLYATFIKDVWSKKENKLEKILCQIILILMSISIVIYVWNRWK